MDGVGGGMTGRLVGSVVMRDTAIGSQRQRQYVMYRHIVTTQNGMQCNHGDSLVSTEIRGRSFKTVPRVNTSEGGSTMLLLSSVS